MGFLGFEPGPMDGRPRRKYRAMWLPSFYIIFRKSTSNKNWLQLRWEGGHDQYQRSEVQIQPSVKFVFSICLLSKVLKRRKLRKKRMGTLLYVIKVRANHLLIEPFGLKNMTVVKSSKTLVYDIGQDLLFCDCKLRPWSHNKGN